MFILLYWVAWVGRWDEGAALNRGRAALNREP